MVIEVVIHSINSVFTLKWERNSSKQIAVNFIISRIVLNYAQFDNFLLWEYISPKNGQNLYVFNEHAKMSSKFAKLG